MSVVKIILLFFVIILVKSQETNIVNDAEKLKKDIENVNNLIKNKNGNNKEKAKK